jgi:hypothetical protein
MPPWTGQPLSRLPKMDGTGPGPTGERVGESPGEVGGIESVPLSRPRTSRSAAMPRVDTGPLAQGCPLCDQIFGRTGRAIG